MATLVAGSALTMFASPASADDEPPPPPGQTILPPGGISVIGSALAQSGSPAAGPLGLPDMSALGANLLLGQYATPSAPSPGAPAAVAPLSAFQSDYLVPQNTKPAAPGQGTPAPGIGPDADNPGTGRIAFLKRLHEMYAAGELKGSLLGQRPLDSWDVAPDGAPLVPVPGPPAAPSAVSIPN